MTKFASLLAATGVALLASTSAFADGKLAGTYPGPGPSPAHVAVQGTPAAGNLGPSDAPVWALTSTGYVTYPSNAQTGTGIDQHEVESHVNLSSGQWVANPAFAAANNGEVEVAGQASAVR